MCPDTKSEQSVQHSGISRQVPAHRNDPPANPLYCRHTGHLVIHSLSQADRSTDVTPTLWGESLQNDRFVWDSGRYCQREWPPLLAAQDCRNSNSLFLCGDVALNMCDFSWTVTALNRVSCRYQVWCSTFLVSRFVSVLPGLCFTRYRIYSAFQF